MMADDPGYPPGCRKAFPMVVLLTLVAMWKHRKEIGAELRHPSAR
jgi:hypothetical protein